MEAKNYLRGINIYKLTFITFITSPQSHNLFYCEKRNELFHIGGKMEWFLDVCWCFRTFVHFLLNYTCTWVDDFFNDFAIVKGYLLIEYHLAYMYWHKKTSERYIRIIKIKWQNTICRIDQVRCVMFICRTERGES